MAKLTKAQRLMLYVLSGTPLLVPYGDTVAVSLVLKGLAERTATFERLRITRAGRAALSSAMQAEGDRSRDEPS